MTTPMRSWRAPVALEAYDQTPTLTKTERQALQKLGWQLRRRRGYDATRPEWTAVTRLLEPLDAARIVLHHPDTGLHSRSGKDAIGLVLWRCADESTAYWGWTAETWVRLIGSDRHAFAQPWPNFIDQTVRPYLAAYAYLLCRFSALDRIGPFNRLGLAWRVFGRSTVDAEFERVATILNGWGYRSAHTDPRLRTVLCHALLLNRSPYIDDLTTEALLALRDDPAIIRSGRGQLHAIHRAVAALGHVAPPTMPTRGWRLAVEDAPREWMKWVDRWHDTSTLTPEVRREYRSILAKTGRWLAREHPGVTEPSHWSRELCAAFVARVTKMAIGDFAQRRVGLSTRLGRPLAATSKAGYITVVRTFFRCCQEWGWCEHRFDPSRALATPKSIKALLGPQPRVIADEAWAKLLWAGLNLDAGDLSGKGMNAYPLPLIRAIALTWLFAGQRSDEIVRLRVGCVRWHNVDSLEDPVCLLDIPTHKTGTAFTKPVDPLLGRAIEAWQAVRPTQPQMLDRKTGEAVDLLFAYRARPVANTYINASIIPILCHKAGVPPTDVRGRITSHRARATIASQLYNAKEPMTLFELQAWLGHRSPETTQHYAQITPNTLTKAYTDAGYFARNVRTIEVLIDRDAVLNGAAAAGEPWQHYDLGHGYCSYTFFEQCPHRMACARCDFYIPKPSSRGQLLEAKANVDRRLALIPLTDGELAAVEQDRTAVEKLLEALADTPTPAGQTPREIALRSSSSSQQQGPSGTQGGLKIVDFRAANEDRARSDNNPNASLQ